MRRSRILIATAALAALAAGGGITAAATTGSSAGSPRAATSAPAVAPAAPGGAATVHTAIATVGGSTQTILVNAQGLPLYYYRPDTATRSLVTGGLAGLWPPLTSAAPTAAGVNGKVTVVKDTHGDQVAYNGHLLYTFKSDRPGQATGQGFQNFFVVTPGLTPGTSSASPTTVPAAPSGGYGY